VTCADCQLRIDDLVDGALEGAAREPVDAHLATCADCRRIVDETEAIRSAAASLEPHVLAPQVWGRIAAAVEADRQRPWWQIGGLRLPQLAAAAAAIAIIAGVGAMAWRDLAPRQQTGTVASVDPDTNPDVAVSVNDEFQLAEDEFVQAIQGLEQETDTTQLDPETADVVNANLTVLNQAIGESRAALASEPESEVAQDSLFDALRSKVELLQNALALVNEMRQGNQAGAAAIVSGQNQ
jgi:hypothetical protein